jgi:hypothetical protein
MLFDGSDGRGSVDEVLAAGVDLAAEPAGAAALQGLEEQFGILFQAETVAGLQVVEGEGGIVRVVSGVETAEEGLDVALHGVGEGDAARVFLQQGLHFGREEVCVCDEQLAVFLLPFVSVRGREWSVECGEWRVGSGEWRAVFLVCFEVCGFV